MSDFMVWADSHEDNSTNLMDLDGIDRPTILLKGLALSADWPADVTYGMDRDRPDDILLLDNVSNIMRLVVVTRALGDFIAQASPGSVELLPVAIKNHRGKITTPDYCIVNARPLQDALDPGASGAVYSRIRPTEIKQVEKLVIDPERVDPAVAIFRLARFTQVMVVRPHLAEAITKAGFTGVRWVPASEFPQL